MRRAWFYPSGVSIFGCVFIIAAFSDSQKFNTKNLAINQLCRNFGVQKGTNNKLPSCKGSKLKAPGSYLHRQTAGQCLKSKVLQR